MSWRYPLVTLFFLLLVACRQAPPEPPTLALVIPSLTPSQTIVASQPPTITPTIPTTWTPQPTDALLIPTLAKLQTTTPAPTNTPFPTRTATPTATGTSTYTPVPTETSIAAPTTIARTPVIGGANLLPNPSFEEGWYHLGGAPELQIPNQWHLEWDEGYNSLDSDPWNEYARPESRILSSAFLPANEHQLFIWDGDHTLKIFKGTGALYFRFVTYVFLEPGSYQFEVNVFPDMVDGYTDSGSKIWAPDPLSGELRFIVDYQRDNWILPIFGQKLTYRHNFEVTSIGSVRVGVAFRGRWAIENNGWFMDDWSLVQLASGG